MKMRITILGLGTMGRGVAGRLVHAGNEVSVWNRTRAVSETFATQQSVRVADDVASAVSDADVVLSFLTDDLASRDVWGAVLPACAPATVVVECSTVSPDRAEEFVTSASAAGLVAAVALMVGSKPQADGGMLTFLTGGSDEAATRCAPVLEPASSSVRHVGSPRTAAILKLSINTLLAAQLATMAAIKNVTDAAEGGAALDLVTDIPVFSPIAVGLLARMRSGDFTPNFSVDLIEKDLGYMVGLAQEQSVDASVLSAVQAVFTRAAVAGLGDQDFSVIGK
jgi:3-hydroxyisobutyrate dehydrogenase